MSITNHPGLSECLFSIVSLYSNKEQYTIAPVNSCEEKLWFLRVELFLDDKVYFEVSQESGSALDPSHHSGIGLTAENGIQGSYSSLVKSNVIEE